MQKFSKILIAVAVLGGIIAIGVALGWFAGKTPEIKSSSPPADTAIQWHPVETNHVAAGPVVRTTNTAGRNIGMKPLATSLEPVADSGLITNWEDRVEEILADDTDDTNKVALLFALFPNLPPDGQTEVAQHLSNLVDDDHYAPLGQMARDARLPEDVSDVLLSDLLNRPNATKLPVLLDIASNPDHVKAGEAKDLLELYLDQDYGTDWDKWRQAAKDWLKDNPD